MDDTNKPNEKRILNEDELEKMVGGTTQLTTKKCQRCDKTTVWDNGHSYFCTSCGWILSHT